MVLRGAVVGCPLLESGLRVVGCGWGLCRGSPGPLPGKNGRQDGSLDDRGGGQVKAALRRIGGSASVGAAFERRAQGQRHHHAHRQPHPRFHLRPAPNEVALKAKA